MEVGEDAAFARHAIEVRRFVGRCAERADVGVAQVVDEDDDDVGRPRLRRAARSSLLRTANVRRKQRQQIAGQLHRIRARCAH